MNQSNPISRAIDYVDTISNLAARCGVKYQAIQGWQIRGKVPADQVLKIVRAVNGAVTPHELRPDIYPDPQWMPPDLEYAGSEVQEATEAS